MIDGEEWSFDADFVSYNGEDLCGREALNLPIKHTFINEHGMRFAQDRERIVWISHYSPDSPAVDGIILHRPGHRHAMVTTNFWAPDIFRLAFNLEPWHERRAPL